MKEKKGKLNRKREQALLALIEKPTVKEAAKHVGIGECTLYRWLKEDTFQQDYRKIKQDIVGHAITQLQGAAKHAVDALVEIVKDKEKPSSVRVMSARSILDFSAQGVERENIEEKILYLEKRIKRR